MTGNCLLKTVAVSERNFGWSAAPEAFPVPLLPSGPGGVRGTSLHRARSSTLRRSRPFPAGAEKSLAHSLAEEMRSKLLFRNVSQRLSVDSKHRAAIQFTMIRNRKGLSHTVRKHPPQLIWLPRCDATLNPNTARILTTS